MAVYVALFGEQNYEWPECLSRNTIATPNDIDDFAFWQNGDREGYIQHRMKGLTVAGKKPTRAVASRWFDLKTIVSQSVGDIWIHHDGTRVWWTRTNEEAPEFIEKIEPVGRKRHVVICHKPCDPWRNIAENGTPIYWDALHPKARDILNTPATIRQLSGENRDYVMAILRGEDLSAWHSLPAWTSKAAKAKKGGGTVYDGLGKSVWRMAETAFATVAQANGRQVLKTMKVKEMGFTSKTALEAHLRELLEMQDHQCALTGLPFSYDDPDEDRQMWPSLDRIDSSGHYAEGNLQVVCAFINRWKGADDNEEFKRLLKVVRG